jgi:putative transposase
MVDPVEPLSVRRQCELLDVNRNRLEVSPRQESAENLEIMRKLDERYLERPTHGVLRMQDFLREEGYMVNEKRVRRLLRKMGLLAIYPKPNLSRLGLGKYIHPYLLRGLEIVRPNQVWAIDITYIPMAKGFQYLTAIIDLYSRFVVGWDISNSLDAESSHRVLRRAMQVYGKPEIVNSDQGSQFTCKEWIELLRSSEVRISMDGKGRALDNVFIERLWRSVKYDHVYLNPATDGAELYAGLKDYFEEYNRTRHQGINRSKPMDLYQVKAA